MTLDELFDMIRATHDRGYRIEKTDDESDPELGVYQLELPEQGRTFRVTLEEV